MRAVVPTLLLAVLLGGCGGSGVHLSVTPVAGPVDQPFEIRATGFRSRERVTLRLSGTEGGEVWRGQEVVSAGEKGELVLHDRYLLGRLRSGRGNSFGSWPKKLTVTVRGRDGSASVSVRRETPRPQSLGRDEKRPREVGFFGEWIHPRGAVPRTSILVVGGSDGGLSSYTETIASTLAGHGYPVLELAYFNEPGLPSGLERIRLEYFRRAIGWMRRQREVDPNRVVILGVSRGGELSLILASIYPRLVRADVAYVPVQWVVAGYPDSSQPAWMYHGKPFKGDRGAIPVEQTAGPVFVVGGGDDEIWPSGPGVTAIAHRMHAHGRTDVTALTYPNAGHGLGTAVPVQLGAGETNIPGFGGSPRADELAREDSWPKLLRFLAQL